MSVLSRGMVYYPSLGLRSETEVRVATAPDVSRPANVEYIDGFGRVPFVLEIKL